MVSNEQTSEPANSEESFEEEAKRLGQSDKFIEFLADRMKKPAQMSLKELKRLMLEKRSSTVVDKLWQI